MTQEANETADDAFAQRVAATQTLAYAPFVQSAAALELLVRDLVFKGLLDASALAALALFVFSFYAIPPGGVAQQVAANLAIGATAVLLTPIVMVWSRRSGVLATSVIALLCAVAVATAFFSNGLLQIYAVGLVVVFAFLLGFDILGRQMLAAAARARTKAVENGDASEVAIDEAEIALSPFFSAPGGGGLHETSPPETRPSDPPPIPEMRISTVRIPLETRIIQFEEPVLGQPGIEALAPRICSAFARWSLIEKQLDQIHALITGGDMDARGEFDRLKGWDRRTKAIVAASDGRLSDDDRLLLKAVLALAEAPATKRHELAHGVWAQAQGAEDRLVLMSPETQNLLGQLMAAAAEAGTTRLPVDHSRIFEGSRLISAGDLDLLLRELADAHRRLDALYYGHLAPACADATGDGFADYRRHLAEDPEVSARVTNMKVSLRQAERAARKAAGTKDVERSLL